MPTCVSCNLEKDGNQFSSAQKKKGAQKKCLQCINHSCVSFQHPVQLMQTVTQTPVTIIDTATFEAIRTENVLLKRQVQELSKDNALLENSISEKLATIQSLYEQNNLLRQEIEQLKQSVEEQKQLVKKQQQLIEEQHQHFKEQTVRKGVNSLSLAIQEFNRMYQLEIHYRNIEPVLKRLRKRRVELAHYIIENEDSANLKEYKLRVLYEKIVHMDPDIRTEFERKYPGLLAELTQILEGLTQTVNKNTISQEDIDDVDEWWKE